MIKNALELALANVWPMLTIFCVIIITIRIAYLKVNKLFLDFFNMVLYTLKIRKCNTIIGDGNGK